MRFLKPTYSKWFISLGILLLPALLPRCMPLHMSDKRVKEYFKDEPEQPSFYEYTFHGRRIHYAAIGADMLPSCRCYLGVI